MPSENELHDAERGAAERQVDYFVDIVSRRYGIEPSELPEILENMRWLHKHRQLAARIAGGVTIMVIGAVALMTLSTLWEGFKNLVSNTPVK
jgi:hypothetical protein